MDARDGDDAALVDALKDGGSGALNAIISRWEKPLVAFAWRYLRNLADAEDLTAETFVRLHQHRERLRAHTNLSAWLFTTLANLCHNHHRWRRRHHTLSLDVPGESASEAEHVTTDGAETGADALEHDEALAALTAAIERLPHALKLVVLLHYQQQLSYREIAAVVGCSERGIETRLYRARQQLRRELGDSIDICAAASRG